VYVVEDEGKPVLAGKRLDQCTHRQLGSVSAGSLRRVGKVRERREQPSEFAPVLSRESGRHLWRRGKMGIDRIHKESEALAIDVCGAALQNQRPRTREARAHSTKHAALPRAWIADHRDAAAARRDQLIPTIGNQL
jgi:hypothetical protein